MADRPDIIRPVILSGGAGTRLWPLSRALYPKQLLPLGSERSMLQETALRVRNEMFGAPIVVCNDEHRFIVAEQLRQLEIEPAAILLEPVGKNTAPAAAVAAAYLAAGDTDSLILLLPSDHLVKQPEHLIDAVRCARGAAGDGALVTIGITPTRAETGYGYIKPGDPVNGLDRVYRVAEFVEKPSEKNAADYLESGGYLWNGGIFLFTASHYLQELEKFQPEMARACREAVARGRNDLDFFRLEPEIFGAIRGNSIDYAVMEHTDSAAVVPVDMGWSDVGSWSALWDIADKDADGNVITGDVITQGVKNSYLRADDRMVAAIGLEDVVIVATDDAVLATTRDQAQSVKDLVESLKSHGRAEHSTHTKVYRPWGWYQTLNVGDRFQVKLITVNPGARISLQLHHQRAEHWVVVAGTATVTRDDQTFELNENESTFIPIETKHRLENATDAPLRIIEVQSGVYLGEDDILRFDDEYGRD